MGSIAAVSFTAGFATAIPVMLVSYLLGKMGVNNQGVKALLGLAVGFAGLYFAAGYLGVAAQPLLIAAAVSFAVIPIITIICFLASFIVGASFACLAACCCPGMLPKPEQSEPDEQPEASRVSRGGAFSPTGELTTQNMADHKAVSEESSDMDVAHV
jgi:hypothetical protein